MQQSVRNVCAKFKVDRFRTGARQVFTTHPSEIPLTTKLQYQIRFKIRFLTKLPSVKFLLKSLASNKSILKKKVDISKKSSLKEDTQRWEIVRPIIF